ncbi:hypothetical protein MKY04_09285 [Lysinibacillus telephonicus]|uniref:hypothetical protein n=1 Tax=Lysinibacillus telephonicus TaxID=1714840 RepID=UPI0031FBC7B7
MIVHNKGNYTRHAAGVMVIPGVNTIEDADFEKFSKHPLIKTLINKGEIVVPEGSSSEKAQTLKDLSAEDAIELVKDTFSVEYLEELKESETRKTVLTAIDAQIKSIVEGDEQ